MIQKTGFDNERYIKEQTAEILITRFDEQPAAINIQKQTGKTRHIRLYTLFYQRLSDGCGNELSAKMEMIRRYFRYRCEYAMGFADRETVQRVELFLKDFNLEPEERSVVTPAREAAGAAPAEARDYERGNEGIFCGAALELKDGTIITGSNLSLMHAVKHLAEIPDKIKLLPSHITDSVKNLKTEILDEKSASLDLEEALIAISISAANNPAAQLA